MHQERRRWLLQGAALALLPAAAHGLVREQRVLFGSPIELLLPDTAPRAASEEVLQGLAAMNLRWNAWKPGDLDDLNRALRVGRAHRTTPALRSMIVAAGALEASSGGLFNPAIGAWVGAWGFHADALHPGPGPLAAQVTRWSVRRPSLAQLQVRGDTLSSTRRDLQLDFGAYAKGVALDWALGRLARRGVSDALLNLGGNLAAMGRLDGRAWRVGIRDPHGPGLAAALQVQGREAVVTSGSYERWRLVDGVRRSHVIDPSSGWPVRGLDSVTVVHADAAFADAAATALLAAGASGWRAVAARMGARQVLVIDDRGHRSATPLLAARLTPLEASPPGAIRP